MTTQLLREDVETAPTNSMRDFVQAGIHRNTDVLFFDGRLQVTVGAVDHTSADLDGRLQSLGFEPLGTIVSQSVNPGDNPYGGEDAAEYDEYMARGDRISVMVSADGTTIAEAEFSHRTRHLRFRTLFESGDILETRMAPKRAARQGTDQEEECQLPDWIDRILGGDLDNLHASYPHAGFWRQNIEEPNVSVLWRQHQASMARARERLDSEPSTIQNVDQVTHVLRRAWHVTQWHLDCSLRLLTWGGWLFQLAAMALIVYLAAGQVAFSFAASLSLATLAASVVIGRGNGPGWLALTVAPCGMLIARTLGQPVLASGFLVIGVQLAHALHIVVPALILARCGLKLAAIFKRPRRIPAKCLATSYPHPQSPK